MRRHVVALALVLAAAGCQCFLPVEDCALGDCPDGGSDSGIGGGRGGGAGVGGGLGDGGGVGGGGGGGGGGSAVGGGFGGGLGDAGAVDGGACAPWDGVSGVGICAALTGWAFTGAQCQGQCVLYPISAPGLHRTLSSCVQCGCDPGRIVHSPANPTPVGPATHCDVAFAHTVQPFWMTEAFPELADGGCVQQPDGSAECFLGRGTLGDAGYARLCAATLVPGTSQVVCRIYLP